MPVDLVFHKRDALAFDGGANNRSRSGVACLLAISRGEKCLANLQDIVSIDANYIPSECAELLAKVPQRTDIGYMAIYLQVIEVNNGDKIVKLVMGGSVSKGPA